jgi:hypothetical protein
LTTGSCPEHHAGQSSLRYLIDSVTNDVFRQTAPSRINPCQSPLTSQPGELLQEGAQLSGLHGVSALKLCCRRPVPSPTCRVFVKARDFLCRCRAAPHPLLLQARAPAGHHVAPALGGSAGPLPAAGLPPRHRPRAPCGAQRGAGGGGEGYGHPLGGGGRDTGPRAAGRGRALWRDRSRRQRRRRAMRLRRGGDSTCARRDHGHVWRCAGTGTGWVVKKGLGCSEVSGGQRDVWDHLGRGGRRLVQVGPGSC